MESIFSGISTTDLAIDLLVAIADEIEIAANRVLFAVGQATDAFFVLLTGGIDLVNHFTGSDERLLARGPRARSSAKGETSLLIDETSLRLWRGRPGLLRFSRRRFQEMLDGGRFPRTA